MNESKGSSDWQRVEQRNKDVLNAFYQMVAILKRDKERFTQAYEELMSLKVIELKHLKLLKEHYVYYQISVQRLHMLHRMVDRRKLLQYTQQLDWLTQRFSKLCDEYSSYQKKHDFDIAKIIHDSRNSSMKEEQRASWIRRLKHWIEW